MTRKSIKRLLIANRGEIAIRIGRTAKTRGIHVIAVYSDADRNAAHVREADSAYHIGPAPASESYLRSDVILDIAKKSGADAIHPGYGFLSENPEFARACAEADIIFIGPSAEAMEAMALKGEAKALMEKAGVPVVPGYHGDDHSLETMAREADRIGYPVLIKAVAGGGGKGMRQVMDASQLEDAAVSASREGEKSFKNGKLLIEKLITRPRHIEIQVFGDSHGNVVHLWERDCSVQRRHQKVLEEAPAPGMPQTLRDKMGAAAIRAAKAINYEGAGTVEFIVDASKPLDQADFYFMEMNTRLQVEHPVTECISGIDLVDWQISVALGQPLRRDQADLDCSINGHAIEARLYAEDPENGFLPSIGTIELFDPNKTHRYGTRIDSGVVMGDTVTMHYDPMIAKMIAHADTREEAIDELILLLESAEIGGLRSNREFLIRALDHAAFRTGDVHTGFIQDHESALLKSQEPTALDYVRAALEIIADRQTVIPADEGPAFTEGPWETDDAFRLNCPAQEKIAFLSESETVSLTVTHLGNKEFTLDCNGACYAANLLDGSWLEPQFIEIDGIRYPRVCHRRRDHIQFIDDRRSFNIPLADASGDADDAMDGPGAVSAPMPGKILSIAVREGDSVERGDALLVMEAMKMEQTLTAPRAGVVTNLDARAGEQVADGATLLTIEDA